MQQIVNDIDKFEIAKNNKRWTLEGVYEVLTKYFPTLKNNKNYNCVRTAIIEKINLSHNKNDKSDETKINTIEQILVYINQCK